MGGLKFILEKSLLKLKTINTILCFSDSPTNLAEGKSDTDYPTPAFGISGKPISTQTPVHLQKNLITTLKAVKQKDGKTPETNGHFKVKINFKTDKSKSKRKARRSHSRVPLPPPEGDYTINYNTNQQKGRYGKLFICNVCKHDSVTYTNWQIHYRSHTGEKPFKCDNCQRQFASKSNRKSHSCKPGL